MLSQSELIRPGNLPHSGLNFVPFLCGDSSAPLVIFLPGIATYAALYESLLSQLSGRGFNVIALDYPGHGDSPGARGFYQVSEVTGAVSELIDFATRELTGRVYIYGYSIGSLLAVAAAEQDERVAGVICETLLVPDIPPGIFYRLSWNWIWSTALFMPAMLLPLSNLVDYERLMACLPQDSRERARNDRKIVLYYPLSTLASLFGCRLKIVHSPQRFKGVIIHGRSDRVLPFDYSKKLQRKLIHGFDMMEMEGSHMLPWEDPAGLAQAVAQWIGCVDSSA